MNIILIALSFAMALIGVVSYNRLRAPFRLLSWYLLIMFGINAANWVVIRVYTNNRIILDLETFANLVFFSLVYYFLIKNRYIKLSMSILSIFGILLFIFDFLILEPKAFLSIAMIFNDALFVICSLLLFRQMLQYPLQINISQQSIFWYNTAILFFYSTMILNFSMVNYYSVHNIQSKIESYSWYVAEIALNLMLGAAVFTDRRNPRRPVPF